MLKDLAPHAWPARSRLADLLLVFGLYGVLAYLAIVTARQPGSIATIWPANGAAIALIVSAPWDRRWGLLAAAAVGNMVANLAYGDTLALSLAFLPPNSLEVALGVHLVARSQRSERFASDHESFLRVLLAGAILPPVLGATIGAATLEALAFGQFHRVWTDWYIGAALGGVSALPLVLALRSGRWSASQQRFSDLQAFFSVAAVGAVTLCALRLMPYPFVAMGVALMVVAFVQPRLTTFGGAFALVAALAAALATGWFVPAGVNNAINHALIFGAALLVVVPAQVVAVVVARQRALTDMLSAVGSRVDDIVVFVDMTGVYRWVNQARERYWGTPKDAVLGRTWAENMSTSAYQDVVRPLFERALAGEVAQAVIDFDYPRLGRRTMDMSMQPARDEEGQQIGVLYCGTDITELEASRREAQQFADQLLVANRSLEQFVRISSHDLREPLNTIVQFCGLIESGPAEQLDDKGRLYFGQVRQGAARMKTMLDDVLQFVRIEEKQDLALELVDLDATVVEVLEGLTAMLQLRAAKVTVRALGHVRGHPALLALVLQNLISNAVKFVAAERTPEIEISTIRSEGWLRVCVADNGIGIEPQRIGELGTPFRRLHSRRKFEGTGLGLAICKRIAEQHGGRVEVESEPGGGSRFCIVLQDPSEGAIQPSRERPLAC